ncbi:DNA glycosylase superfamily protein [Perilla frutescens var. hirtella]|uniref:DNA glycosylase superfamily protein n=1 Tax=Perilla frutescens var. hirtella TaxID=608512 RepID=A0AAD4J5Z3_PERFH|nr:DNA glycosylase superfamily protein [Perilla frutescens var. hirtella]
MSMNTADSETRAVLCPGGNKAERLIYGKNATVNPLRKAENSKEEVVAVEDKKGALLPVIRAKSSHLAHSVSVPSILRRHESFLSSNLSLNASCSSDASTDSFHSRASTGRMCRRSSQTSWKKKQLPSKARNGVVPNEVPESLPEAVQAKRRCAWAAVSTESRVHKFRCLKLVLPFEKKCDGELESWETDAISLLKYPLYVAFHDEEWGVPAHDDKKLFEFLVLSGALAELTWPAILSKRHIFREVFADFDPIAVAKLSEKKITAPGNLASSLLSELKLRSIIENARQVSKVIDEYGSFNKYIWSFVNEKAIVSSFRYPRQVAVKSPKADLISKDLVRRGFRGVGPTVVYSFMQVAGLTNDHLMSCFRFHDCVKNKSEEKKAASEIYLHITS